MSDFISREKVLNLVAESGKFSLMAMIADPEIMPSADVRENRWIPVSERLPDKNGRYLVTVKQGYITFGEWIGVAENWTMVTAWMPLPEPYKAERGE